jgi:hypothetical protein
MALSDVHRDRLLLCYGINTEDSQTRTLIESGLLKSVTTTEELQSILSRNDVVGTGIYIGYPNDSGSFTVRLDEPIQRSGKDVKYLRRSNELNHLFVPPGLDLDNTQDLIITEGELKSLSGHQKGLPVVALSGIWNWRTQGPEAELLSKDEKLVDSEALISELRRDWKDKTVTLVYDNDITKDHPGYPAFERLAEQLYKQGAKEIKIVTLPSLDEKSKIGLDDFLLAKGDSGTEELRKIISHAEPYLPLDDGAETFAERHIMSDKLEDKLRASVAYLGCKGEFITKDWLKKYILLAEDRKSLFRDAKLRLGEINKNKLRLRTKDRESNSKLGPVYNQPNSMLKGSSYYIDERGYLCKHEFKKVDDDRIIFSKPLCNFVPHPIRQLAKDNGIEVEKFLEIAAIRPDGGSFPSAIVPMATFDLMKWVASSWGARASIEVGWKTKDEVRHCMQTMVTNGQLPEETVYTHLGWRKIGTQWIYLHAGGAIGSQVQVEPHKRLDRYVLPEKTDNLIDALKASLSLLELTPREITIPLLSQVYLSPLCEPLRLAGIEPGFLMWLFGPTGSMKSTLAALFLSHYGNFDNKSLPTSFRDTATSLEAVTFGCKDSLLVIDDFYPANSYREKEKLENIAQQLTRAYGDRTGRGRATSNLTARASYPPRGMALATGEEMPSGESTMARHIILEMSTRTVRKDKLREAQAQRTLLGQAMRGYLEWLSPQLDSLPEKLLLLFNQLRDRAQKEGRHPRLPEAAALLYLGFNRFLEFCVSQQVLSEHEGTKLAEEAWNTLNQVIETQSEIIKDQQPVSKFFSILQELLAQKRVYLANLKNVALIDVENLLPEKQIGWVGDGMVYLSMNNSYTAVYNFLKDQGEIFPIKKTTLIKHIAQMSPIVQSQGKGNVIQKRFGDVKAWVIPVNEHLLGVE